MEPGNESVAASLRAVVARALDRTPDAVRFEAPPREIARGVESRVWAFELAADDGDELGALAGPLVLRIAEREPDVERDRCVEVLQRTLREQGLPVPVIALSEGSSGNPFGAPFQISSRLRGGPLDAVLTTGAGPRVATSRAIRAVPLLRSRLPHALADFQLRLHAVAVGPVREALAAAGVDEARLPASAGVARLEERLARADARGELDAARRALLEAFPFARRPGAWDESEPVLCHGDVIPGNLLVEDGALCGVVDWAGARIAHPAYDVAWTHFAIAHAPIAPPGIPRALVERIAGYVASRHLARYRQERPIDATTLAHFEMLHALQVLAHVVLDRIERPPDRRSPYDAARPLARIRSRVRAQCGVDVPV